MKRPLIRRKWLLIPAIVILVITVALLTPSGPDKGVSVTFQYFTNRYHEQTAVFVITNQHNYTIRSWAWPTSYELKSNGVWITPYPASGKRFNWGWNGTLEPRAWATVAVVIPDETNDWRAAVLSGRPPGKLGRLLFHSKANLKAAWERQSLPGFKVSVPLMSLRTNYSREFTGEFNALEPSSSAEIPAPPR